MKGNFHVQFLGEGVAATSPPYPTPGWATTQVYPARISHFVADLSGLIIDGLTTTADSTCLDGNGTANPAKTGGCIGDPKRKEHGAQGVGLRKSEFVPIPTVPDHPSFY